MGAQAVYWVAGQQFGISPSLDLKSSLFGRGFAFLVGGYAAWIYERYGAIFVSWTFWQRMLLGVVLLCVQLFLLQSYGLAGQLAVRETMPLFHYAEATLWAGLLFLCLSTSQSLAALNLVRLLQHFGKISYSLYLVHVPIQFYLIYPIFSNGTQPYTVATSFALAWGLAFICYHLVERPFLRLKLVRFRLFRW